jgi:hypothetical protein
MKEFLINNLDDEYNYISFYLATNLHAELSNDENKRDKLLLFSNTFKEKVPLLVNENSSDNEDKLDLTYELGPYDKQPVDFKYKNVDYTITITTLGDAPLGFQFLKMCYQISIMYDSLSDLQEFLDASKIYFNQYRLKITKKESIRLYYNDGGFWELSGHRNKRKPENVYLPPGEKEKIIKKIELFNSPETKARYERFGIFHKYVCLFYGVPGSGKTSLVTAIASELGLNIASLSFEPKTTDSKFRRLVQKLPRDTLLLIEDMDCLFKDRKKNDEMKNSITLSGILNCLDGLASKEGMIVFITTNHIKNLFDEALIRPGRIDDLMEFTYIKRVQLEEMYKIFMEHNYDESKMKNFIKTYNSLNVKCTTALMQNYLFRYVDQPDEALEHIDDIKDMKEKTTLDKEADMYV